MTTAQTRASAPQTAKTVAASPTVARQTAEQSMGANTAAASGTTAAAAPAKRKVNRTDPLAPFANGPKGFIQLCIKPRIDEVVTASNGKFKSETELLEKFNKLTGSTVNPATFKKWLAASGYGEPSRAVTVTAAQPTTAPATQA